MRWRLLRVLYRDFDSVVQQGWKADYEDMSPDTHWIDIRSFLGEVSRPEPLARTVKTPLGLVPMVPSVQYASD